MFQRAYRGRQDRQDAGDIRSGKRFARSPVPDPQAEKKLARQQQLRRPGYASGAYQMILLIANHYQITIPKVTAYVYDIRIIPVRKNATGHWIHIFNQDRNEEKKRLRKLLNEHNRLVMSKIVESNSDPDQLFHDSVTGTRIEPVFDGFHNFYTAKPLAKITPKGSAAKDRDSSQRGFVHREKFKENIEVELDPGNVCTFEVGIHYASSVDLDSINQYMGASKSVDAANARDAPAMPLDAIKAVDIILRHGPTINRIPIAAALYSQDGEKYPVAGHKDVIYGHFQSMRATEAGATLNIDRISAVFFSSGPLLEIIARMEDPGDPADPDYLKGVNVEDFLRSDGMRKYDAMKLTKVFNNMAVMTIHDLLPYKRKFKVKNVTHESAANREFEWLKDGPSVSDHSRNGARSAPGKRISVAKYYEEKYGIKLKYPDLPCLQTGSDKRPVYFPLELVHIQPKQQTVNLTNKERNVMMTRSGKQTTQERFAIIDKSAKTVIQDSEKQLIEFQISMKDQPLHVKGNILPHPFLDFGDRLSVRPVAGKWDMKDKKLYRPADPGLTDWIIVNLDNFDRKDERRKGINHFADSLRAIGNAMGLTVSKPLKPAGRSPKDLKDDYFVDLCEDPEVDYRWRLDNVLRRNQIISKHKDHPQECHYPTLKGIIFIFNEKNDMHYHQIKLVCDVQRDIMSQCVFSKNIQQMDEPSHPSFLQNIILKINTKLGGINCLISDTDRLRSVVDRYTMFMGADVTHPALSDSVTSSIAAVTASCDREQYFYEVALRVQLSYKETITDMYDMSCELLGKFYRRRNSLPTKIIFYRDGVSEGQFEAVLKEELAALRRACEKMRQETGQTSLPAITYVVVRKRHHYRFSPVNPEEGVGKTLNVPAGTTVDSDVVSPIDFDFYMCSHEATIGTSRPTHYVVLVDDNSLSPDDLFRITFNLCHLYPPTTKSISIPTPVQYAHLAAKRARSHAIACGDASKIPKRRVHPRQIDEVTRDLNKSIRIADRDPKQAVNMYFI